MSFPLQGSALLYAALGFGFLFGLLLHRARLASYNTIIGQLRLKDFTIIKVMMTAIIIGGIGVYFLVGDGIAKYHVKPADLLAVATGAAIFGIGMALYGYCPGTAITAIGTGSLHALVGFIGMIVGGILYALSFDWVKAHIIPVGQMGKVRLPELTGVPDLVWFGGLAVLAVIMFILLERAGRKQSA
jgi:uncharacterized membrane protein YedE/YeeE